MKIVAASDSSILVEFGESISLETHERVMAFLEAAQRLAEPRIRNLHPAYASVLIDFDPLHLSHLEAGEIAEQLAREFQLERGERHREPRVVAIPVCYDAEFAPDLNDVAGHAGVSIEEVVRLHSSATYVVYFLGFSPGFGYLGGVPETLRMPRLATPRKHVPAGTVAIAGSQAGIYPVDSPGGWRLIGRTPLKMFDSNRNDATLVHPGERVKFLPIDRATFDTTSAGSAEHQG